MFQKILFPIDLHEQAFSLQALQFAVEQAQKDQAELHLLTILPHGDKPTMLDYQHDQDTLQEIERSTHEQLDALIAQQVPERVSVTKLVHNAAR